MKITIYEMTVDEYNKIKTSQAIDIDIRKEEMYRDMKGDEIDE